MGRPDFPFFSHRSCEYFPCHADIPPEEFNCLFCYCPLYALGDRCGGRFSYTPAGIKDCQTCDWPHRRDNYEIVIKRLDHVIQMVQRGKGSV